MFNLKCHSQGRVNFKSYPDNISVSSEKKMSDEKQITKSPVKSTLETNVLKVPMRFYEKLVI